MAITNGVMKRIRPMTLRVSSLDQYMSPCVEGQGRDDRDGMDCK